MNLNFYTCPFPALEVDSDYHLREQDLKDSSPFFQYYTDPEVGQHILASKPRNLLEATQEIHYCRDLFYQQRGIYWSLVEKKTDKMIGAIGLYLNNMHARGEICYDLAQSHWNRGIMTKALKTVIDFSFNTINLIRIEATTLKQNAASNSVLQKLKFEHEGTLKSYRFFENKFYDVEMYALLSPAITRPAALAQQL